MAKNQHSSPNLMIRNSTADFFMFTADSRADGIEVRYENETVWLSQKMMSVLFDVDVKTINEHLRNIFKSQELSKNGTILKFQIVQREGTREVKRFGWIRNQWLCCLRALLINVGLHLKNIFQENEVNENSTIEDFSVVQKEGQRKVTRNIYSPIII